MIRSLRGTVTDCTGNTVVIDVGGIGYLVFSPTTNNYTVGEETVLHTHLAVRENALDLYGFLTRDELEMFGLLLTLPKIGPKSALGVMSNADIVLLKQSILNDDPAHLTKMSGVGKKTAEKIVSGLKSKLEDMGFSAEVVGSGSTGTGAVHAYVSDTIDALTALGYPQHDARKVVQEITAEHPDIKDSAGALKIALKILSN